MSTQPPAVSYITRLARARAAGVIVALGTRITVGTIVIASMLVTGGHRMYI